MKVSVIIPVFNEEKNIASCLDSLKTQQVKPDEIIVVDNNCTDRSMLIAKKYSVRIVKEKRQGMIFARNCGFNAAKFDIVARCDADTILPKAWIKRIKENFKDNKIDALACIVVIHDHWLLKNNVFFPKLYFKIIKLLLKHETLAGPAMVLTKKIWQKVKNEVCLDDKKVHEDIDLSIHIAKYGRIKLDPNLIIYASARRIKNNPLSFFIEYPARVIKTLLVHTSGI
jgi:glycosyltransferase involved in cell wall biosynthesis